MLRLRFITSMALTLGLGVALHVTQVSAQVTQPSSQQTEPTPSDTARAEVEPTPIPASEVVIRAEEATRQLRQIAPRAAADPAVQDLGAELEQLVEAQEELLSQPGSQQPERLSRRNLETLQQQWLVFRNRLAESQDLLGARSQGLGEDRGTVRQIRSLWLTTREVAADEGYPEAAVDRIGSVLAAIDSTDALILTRLDTVLALQGRIADQMGQTEEVLGRIEDASEAARLGLFTPEGRPLWSALASPELRSSLDKLQDSLSADASTVRRFFDDNSEVLFVFAGLFLLLLALMLFLRGRARAWGEEDPELRASTRFLDRPFSASLLVALVLVSATLAAIPQAVVTVIRVVAVVPILRLLPVLVPAVVHRLLYWLVGLWVLDGVQYMLLDGTGAQRLVLLIETAAALLVLIRALRPGGPVAEAVRGRRLARVVFNFSRLGLVTLAASLVANILGFAGLADLLTGATITSAVLAAVLYAAAQVLIGLVSLGLRTEAARSFRSVRRNSDLMRDRARGLLNLAAVIGWFYWTLERFDVDELAVDGFLAILNASLSIGNFSISLGDIVAFVAAVWLATIASRFTRFVLEEDVFPHLALPRGVPGAISKMSHYIIIGLGILIAFTAAGIDISNLTLLVGALGVGIGFGLQNIVNNFVSGLVLMFERPIQVGDTVELAPLIGRVKDIGIRASTVRTFDGAEVIVPNGDLISGRVVNWTLSDQQRRIDVNVGVAYGSNPNQVIDILLEAAKQHPKSLNYPEPFVLFIGFGESSMDFTLRFWTGEFSEWLNVKSDVTLTLHDALYAAGIEIPFPQRDLHLRSVDAAISGETLSKASKPTSVLGEGADDSE